MRSYGSISHELPAGPAVPSDVNIQAAYLHVITDLIQSVGVALAGALIWWKPEWQILDPICTFIFSILVLWYNYSVACINRSSNSSSGQRFRC